MRRGGWPATVAAVIISALVAACGSGSAGGSKSATNPEPTQAGPQALELARCMHAHGVPNFPDPTPNGTLNTTGIVSTSPAFRSAETACRNLMPVKHPPSQAPSAKGYARLLRWAKGMRAHGIASLPDPRPNPPPSPGSAATRNYGTVMGDTGCWVGIPYSANAHSPAFLHLATVCGESPSGPG